MKIHTYDPTSDKPLFLFQRIAILVWLRDRLNHCVLAHYATVLPSTSVFTYSGTPASPRSTRYLVPCTGTWMSCSHLQLEKHLLLLALPYRPPVAVCTAEATSGNPLYMDSCLEPNESHKPKSRKPDRLLIICIVNSVSHQFCWRFPFQAIASREWLLH